MFCPRCGRAVNETSNFCGGCGLSRAEIEKYIVKTQPEAPVPQPEEKTEPVTVFWESQPATETPKAETESGFAEKEPVAEAAKETETAKEQQKADAHQYTYTSAESTYAAQKPEPAAPVKNENLSTVDFIWMMFISGIPVVGLIYLIVLAFSNDNMNKRSYARASLIISIFATIIGVVFMLGFMLSAV